MFAFPEQTTLITGKATWPDCLRADVAEPSNTMLALGVATGIAIGIVSGLVFESIFYGASIAFALAVVFVAGLMGRE